jgi:hypothetical protein
MPTIHSIGRLLCERKGVESAFGSYLFRRGMAFIGHRAGFGTRIPYDRSLALILLEFFRSIARSR